MKKKVSFLLIFFLILIFLFSCNKIEAADAYITGCLNVVGVYRRAEQCSKSPTVTINNANYQCLPFPDNINDLFSGRTDHVALIEGEGLPDGKDIFIVGCISTGGGIQCTSGDSNINARIREIGFVVTDSPSDNFTFKAAQNPTRADGGKVSMIVRSYTSRSRDHLFFGIAEVTQTEYSDTSKTVQYGTFGFSEDPKKCISIHWDPKGRVFDSKSLEPIVDAKVTLLDSNKQKVSMLGLENPLITKEDGLFNFYVPSGEYYLQPEKDNYQFPVLLQEVNSNYDKIYYCDKKIGYPLYNAQHKILEENELLHCDLPLKPIGIPFKLNEPVLMEYGYMVLGNSHKIYGRYSHPLTIVQIRQGEKLIKEVISDKFGGWDITIENAAIETSEKKLEITGTKNPEIYPVSSATTSLNFFDRIVSFIFKIVFSQEINKNRLILPPILRHLEGYAYDSQQIIIPFAKIRIITKMDNKVYFETEADEKGFFRIYSRQLPIFPYHIEINSPSNPALKLTMSTSEFIASNKDYLEKNKINLINATKDNILISSPSATYATPFLSPTGKVFSDISDKLSPTKSNDNQTTRNEILIIVLILILLITGVGILMLYFWKKKKTENFPPPSI